MKYGKLMPVMLVLLAILTIGAVSASHMDDAVNMDENALSYDVGADGMDAPSYGDADSLDEVAAENDDDVLSGEGNEALLDSPGTFTDLNSSLSGQSNVKLNKSYIYTPGIDDGFSGDFSGILLDDTITIDGDGHTIDGGNAVRAFVVKEHNVIFKNINFKNCHAIYLGGGALWWEYGDNGTVINCTFDNCSSGTDGGAVSMASLNGNMEDCTFHNCYSTGGGGAIKFASRNGTVMNCKFDDCYTKSSSGAIDWAASNGVLKNCNFTNCSASAYSSSNDGVIGWSGENGTVDRCNFNSCSSGNGGVIGWTSGNGVVKNSNFKNCIASSNGGAIYWSGKNATVDNCCFENCEAKGFGSGGAITWLTAGSITNCKFTKCSSENYAGAIYWGAFSNGEINNCEFSECSARDYGGAIYIYSDNNVVTDCRFTKCSAKDGGAIYVHGSGNDIAKSSFQSCSASHYGGGIYYEGENCSLANPTFNSNSAIEGPDYFSVHPLNNNTIGPTKLSTSLSASGINVEYGNSGKLVISLKGSGNAALYAKQITVVLNGQSYSGTTDYNGRVSFAVPANLAVKTYSAKITFAGDNQYAQSSKTVNVVVKKATPKLTVKAKTFKRSLKTKKYTITLKDNHNKPMKNTKVSIKINKKTYTAKTNSKGKATFKIKKLTKKGTFKSKVTYNGDKNYNKVTKTVKIKIK